MSISFASGWQPNDFVLAPDNYANRKKIMLEGIEQVRRLWRGETIELAEGVAEPDVHGLFAGARLELNGLDLKRIEADQRVQQQIETREGQIRDLEIELRERQARLNESSRVIADRAGRVLELLVDRGAVIGPGTALLNLELVSEDLMAVVFVPATAGKRVQPGMAVRLSPSTVKREEFGSILGKVTWTAEYPSTARGMARLLNNDALVQKLMQAGPPIQVNIALERDPSTPSGYKWSSSRGPNLQISSGTLATGDIVVRSPIDGAEIVALADRPELESGADVLWRQSHDDVPSALRFDFSLAGGPAAGPRCAKMPPMAINNPSPRKMRLSRPPIAARSACCCCKLPWWSYAPVCLALFLAKSASRR